jgi:hypothetical protein
VEVKAGLRVGEKNRRRGCFPAEIRGAQKRIWRGRS